MALPKKQCFEVIEDLLEELLVIKTKILRNFYFL